MRTPGTATTGVTCLAAKEVVEVAAREGRREDVRSRLDATPTVLDNMVMVGLEKVAQVRLPSFENCTDNPSRFEDEA